MCFLGLNMLDCQSVEAMKSQVEGCLELWLQASLWEESSSGVTGSLASYKGDDCGIIHQ